MCRENHADGDEKEDDSTGDADSWLFEAQEVEDRLSCEQEEDKQTVGDEEFAHGNPSALCKRELIEDGMKYRNVTEWVYDEKQQDGSR